MREPPLVDLRPCDTVRLISSGRLKEPALLALAADRQAFDDLAQLESATNGRIRAEEAGLTDLDPRELVFGRVGATFINAAFAYTRRGGNRFNGEDRGAWYCALEVETALQEVSFHVSRELEAIERFETATDFAELIADFLCPLHDLRNADAEFEAALDADSAIAYPAGQALARSLRRQHASNGIVYPSARRAEGTCLVAFRPDLVQNLRQGGIWRLEWRGTPIPSIERVGL